MITKIQKKQIIKIIGNRYVAGVQSYLRDRGIVNKNKQEHSATQITNVMNGKPHEVIEAAIYGFVAQKKEELAKRKELLKQG